MINEQKSTEGYLTKERGSKRGIHDEFDANEQSKLLILIIDIAANRDGMKVKQSVVAQISY